MPPLDQVLTLRPVNVVRQLADSRLPLLNATDVFRALEGKPAALATLPAICRWMLPGYFRAAREADAMFGLGFAPSQDRGAAARLFQEATASAEEGRHRLPFFLQAGPFVAAEASDERAAALLGRSVYDHIEAGFTLLSLDLEGLPEDRKAAVAVELARPALERELAIEVTAPADPSALPAFVDALHLAGLAPTFLRVSSQAFHAGGEPDWDRIAAFVAVCQELRALPSLELRGRISPRTSSAWTAAGFRKLEIGDELAEAACARLPVGMAEMLSQDNAPWRQLGPVREALESLPEEIGERLEARAFGEALDLLTAAGAERTGKAAVAFLAQAGPA